MAERTLRIAATADLHYAKHSRGTMQDAFAEISRSADVLLLCGYDRHNTYVNSDVEDICGHHSHVVSEADVALAL